MSIDVDLAASFMTAHARLLDRRRFDLVTGPGTEESRAAVLAALDGYRNPDGGYGWGIEPDLRAPESQPACAQHALEAIADAGPATCEHSVALCDWLGSVTLPDGGLPLALPMADAAGCAPFWAQADPRESSLQITAAVAAQAHRVARWDPGVRDHPWLATATRYCFDAIRASDEAPFAYVLYFALQLLDAAADTHPETGELLERLGRYLPADGVIPVAGTDGEVLRPLEYSPEPGRPTRSLLTDAVIAADLSRLEAEQQSDGGWHVDFPSYSPAAALEWRGYMTVHAVTTLRRNGH